VFTDRLNDRRSVYRAYIVYTFLRALTEQAFDLSASLTVNKMSKIVDDCAQMDDKKRFADRD